MYSRNLLRTCSRASCACTTYMETCTHAHAFHCKHGLCSKPRWVHLRSLEFFWLASVAPFRAIPVPLGSRRQLLLQHFPVQAPIQVAHKHAVGQQLHWFGRGGPIHCQPSKASVALAVSQQFRQAGVEINLGLMMHIGIFYIYCN